MFRWKNRSLFLVSGQFLIVFIAVASISVYFYRDFHLPYFIENDSFYHVAIAKYMMEHGLVIKEFPYLHYTILNKGFVDWHFFFHILLMPFIKLFGDVIGPKILGTILVAAVFSVIFLIFREMKLKLASLYAIMLFVLMPSEFYARIDLIRDPVLSLFFMVLSLYLFLKKKPWALLAVMFLYTWAYYVVSFWFIGLILIYLLLQIIAHEKVEYKLLIATTLGFILGFIINPYFPKNISFFVHQLAAVSQNNRLYAGAELFPPNAWAWFYDSLMAVILFFSGIFITIIKNTKQDLRVVAVLLFSFCLLILQWKSSRTVEYWPVWGGMSGILLVGPYVEQILFNLRRNWKSIESIAVVILVLVFIQEGMFHVIWENWDFQVKVKKPMVPTDKVMAVNDYLKRNSNEGDIVFMNWGHFSYFFYFNQKNYYVAGMDPTFLEVYNKDLFDKYIKIIFEDDTEEDLNAIKNDFHAKWVVLDGGQKVLRDELGKRTDLFEQVYDNKTYIVFKVL